MKNISKLAVLFIVSTLAVFSQQLQFPRPSPKATISQTIGMSEVTMTYNRPSVKGRVIWGGLVPYDTVWRTGANEATTISFSDTVMLEGNKLNPGMYMLATIPSKEEWTIIINSKKDLWGAFGYDEKDDILRVKVKPQEAEFTERMKFDFSDLTDSSATIELRWEKLKVPFHITFDTKAIALAKARKTVRWQDPMNAAMYCVTNNFNHEEGLKWINLSLSMDENYSNLRVKARLLEQMGQRKEAIALMEKALEKGKAMENKPFDFDDMQKLLSEWKGKK
jgi:hypothetical protein